MRQLVIRVLWPQPAVTDVAQWLCVREHVGVANGDDPVSLPGSLTLDSALEDYATFQASGMECSIVLPAEITLYDRVHLPARSKRQAMQALPFVVEEQLADDIEGVHLSVGNRQNNGTWPVLAFDVEQMQQLFDLLVHHNVMPYTVSVDAEMLSVASGELRLVMHGERVLLRSESIATAVELENASLYLQMLEGIENYRKILIFLQPEHEQQRLLAEQWSTEFAALDDVVTTINIHPDSLSALLFADPALDAINLLQGRYHLRKPSNGLPWWQVAVACLAVAVSVQVLVQASSGWYFGRQASKLVVMAENRYRELFPDAKKISDPRKRLEGKLAGGDTLANKDAFTAIFSKTVESLQAVAGSGQISIEQLRYEGKRAELELELKTQSIEQLDKFKQALGRAGLQADIASANESDHGILGRVKIKAGT